MRNRPDSGDAAFCPSCDEPRELWFTTCPTCEFPFELGPGAVLGSQRAAPLSTNLDPSEQWIDLPIAADQPAKTALIRTFLADRSFRFEESRRFVSVLAADAAAIEAALAVWAYQDQLPPDHRHLDTLTSTLQQIGDAAIAAIRAAMLESTGAAGSGAGARAENGGPDLDLR